MLRWGHLGEKQIQVGRKQEECFGWGTFERPLRHVSRNSKYAVGYMSLELKREVRSSTWMECEVVRSDESTSRQCVSGKDGPGSGYPNL